MKITFFLYQTYSTIFILLTLNGSLSGQQLSPFVVSSSGGFYSNSAGMLSFTTGELAAVETFSSANNILTQGFQQSWDLGTATDEGDRSQFSFSIFPNPSDGNFNLVTNSERSLDVSVKILNLLGIEVFQEKFYQEQTFNLHALQLTDVPQGIYIIRFIAKEKSSGEEFHFTGKVHIVH